MALLFRFDCQPFLAVLLVNHFVPSAKAQLTANNDDDGNPTTTSVRD